MALGNDKATGTIPYPRQTDALAQVPQNSNALHRLIILSAKASHTSETHTVGHFLPLELTFKQWKCSEITVVRYGL